MYYCVGFTQVFKYDCIIFRRRPLKFFWSYTKICIKEIAMMWPCQAPSKTKTDLFCSWYGYWPHYNAENDHWKRSHSKTLSRVEQFKNDAFWKGWFLVEKTMLSENSDVIKIDQPCSQGLSSYRLEQQAVRWETLGTRLKIDMTGRETTWPWVSKMAGRRYHVASILLQYCRLRYWSAHASSLFVHAHWGYNSVFKTDMAL